MLILEKPSAGPYPGDAITLENEGEDFALYVTTPDGDVRVFLKRDEVRQVGEALVRTAGPL